MIQIYIEHIDKFIENLTESQRQHMLSLICVARKERVERMRIAEARDKTLVAGALLQTALHLYRDDSDTTPYEFVAIKNGKPILKNDEKIHFNMSHSGDFVVIAVGDENIGVDIERLHPWEKCMPVAKRCFHEVEYEWLEKFEGTAIALPFTQIWTGKEAYIKYTGEGLRCPLGSFQVDVVHGVIKENNYVKLVTSELSLDEKETYVLTYCCSRQSDVSLFKIGTNQLQNNLV